MASAQVVETSVNTNNSPSQDYTTNPDDHSNHNTTFLMNPKNITKRLNVVISPRFTITFEGETDKTGVWSLENYKQKYEIWLSPLLTGFSLPYVYMYTYLNFSRYRFLSGVFV